MILPGDAQADAAVRVVPVGGVDQVEPQEGDAPRLACVRHRGGACHFSRLVLVCWP